MRPHRDHGGDHGDRPAGSRSALAVPFRAPGRGAADGDWWGQEVSTLPALSAELRNAVDGWLATGDLGQNDHEGFVRVKGRQREQLVAAGGRSVVRVAGAANAAHTPGQPVSPRGDTSHWLTPRPPRGNDGCVSGLLVAAGVQDQGTALFPADPDLLASRCKLPGRDQRTRRRAQAIRAFAILPALDGDRRSLKWRRQAVLRRYRAELDGCTSTVDGEKTSP